MKMMKTLALLLLTATGLLAQPNPDNMFIDGYVTDGSGNAVANQQVCVYYNSSNPALPSDSLCTNTDSSGYYFLPIQNGSLTGPNVDFNVFTFDPCSQQILTETRSNYQGTIDTANVNFHVCLNGNGCSVQISSSQNPVDPYSYMLSASSSGVAPFTYLWDNGDTTQTTTYAFNQQGIFGACVTVTDASGCTATDCDTLVVDTTSTGNCSAGFYYSNNSNPNSPIVAGDSVSFYFSGTLSNTNYYVWTVQPNGLTSYQQNPVFNFPSSGNYQVCVEVYDSLSNCSDTQCASVVVQSVNANCGGYIVVNGTPGSLPVTLVINSTGVGPFIYQWNTGDTTSVITASSSGTYCVDVTDATGCTFSQCANIVGPSGCNASFTSSGPTPNWDYTFTADTQNLGFDYNWTVDNITVATVYDLQLSGLSNGSHDVCLTVSDSLTGCSAIECQTIIVGCSASFTASGPDQNGDYTFTPDIQNIGWDYSWASDNQSVSSVSIFQTQFSNGVHEVCLTITDSLNNCTDTQCQTITVGCNASFTTSGPDSLNGYTFTSDQQWLGLDYDWTVDNVSVSTVYDAQVSNLTNGMHYVCLTVTDSAQGCSASQCDTVVVGGNNNCFGYISGQIYAGTTNQPLDLGVVYLITHDTSTNQLAVVDSMLIDSGNYYFFGPLDCGDYLVKAAAYQGSQYYANHIPTYYGNSPFWGFAQTVSLNQQNTQTTADIMLIAANNPGGPGFIGGDVTQGANKMDPGDPLAGMEVLLFNLNGGAITYAYTDQNGNFGFSNLAWGTYQVYVEVLGVQTIPAIVTIGPDQPSVDDVHIFVTEELVSTGIEEFNFDGAISEVYPNPVGDDASIGFNLPSAVIIDISILDLTGRTISTESVAIAGGESKLTIRTDRLNSGYYFLNIQDVDGNFSVTRKFMRVD